MTQLVANRITGSERFEAELMRGRADGVDRRAECQIPHMPKVKNWAHKMSSSIF